MTKPTSLILADILNFVLTDNKVRQSLARRDNDDFTRGQEIRCVFHKHHATDSSRSAYIVNIVYRTKFQQDEANDDVTIMVERIDRASPEYRILSTTFY